MFLCAKVYFVCKNKKVVSKRDSIVKCSIELLETFCIYSAIILLLMYYYLVLKHEK